jgi:hypothetical protein
MVGLREISDDIDIVVVVVSAHGNPQECVRDVLMFLFLLSTYLFYIEMYCLKSSRERAREMENHD